MQHTPNYNMKKPGSNEYVMVEDLNENMDTIDRELKENADTIATTNQTVATHSSELEGVKTQITNHETNKSNPHGVTKAQIGLPLTPNGAMATEAQAMAGTSNTEFMSPLRVAQAMTLAGGNFSKQIFTANGTFTAPKAGVYKVTVTGGGGAFADTSANSQTGYSGSTAGGTAIKWVTLTKGQKIPVTVGKGAVRGSGNSMGGTSSFGTHCSGLGGYGPNSRFSSLGDIQSDVGGNAMNGDINLPGGRGGYGLYITGLNMRGNGGSSYWGDSFNHNNTYAYGAGADRLTHDNGKDGVVVVEWA